MGFGNSKTDDINLQIENLKNQNEILLKTLESTKVDLEQKKFYMNEFKEKYSKICVEYDQIKDQYQKYKNDFEDLYRSKKDFEKRIHSNMDSIINIEKELNKANSKLLVYETEKEYITRELDHYTE